MASTALTLGRTFAGVMSSLYEARLTTERVSTETREGHFRAPPVNFRGIRITPDTMVEISAMWACGMAISKPIAASTCDIFSEDRLGNRQSQRQSPLWRICNVSPNPAEAAITAYHFWQAKIFEAAVVGDSYAEIERDRAGQPVALYHLARHRLTPRYDARGRLYYEYRNPRGNYVILAPRDVLHVRGPTYDGVTSYRLWEVARLFLEYSRAVEVFGASFFANGAHLGEVFESDKPIDEKSYLRLQEQLETQHGGPGAANDYMILDNGLKFRQMATDPKASQFIETRQFLVEECCRFMGVPPHKISHLLRSTFNNIEEQNIDFKNDTLIPWATPLQQEIKLKLIGVDSPVTAEFDLDWISEGNMLDVAEADATRAMHGLDSRDEIRARRGRNRRGGKADALTVQKQNIDIEDMGNDEIEDAEEAAPGGRSPARQRRQDQVQRRRDREVRRREEDR